MKRKRFLRVFLRVFRLIKVWRVYYLIHMFFVIMSIPHSFLLGCFIIDWCFYVSWIQGVYKIFYLQILSVCGLIFHFLNSTESLIWSCPVYQFFLLYIMLWVLYLRTLCQTQGLEDIFPICSFKNVIVSAFAFRYNIHFVNFCV